MSEEKTPYATGQHMELQRYPSILIRLSNGLLQLAGAYDSGAGNAEEIREQITTMKETLLNMAATLSIKDTEVARQQHQQDHAWPDEKELVNGLEE